MMICGCCSLLSAPVTVNDDIEETMNALDWFIDGEAFEGLLCPDCVEARIAVLVQSPACGNEWAA